MLKNVHYTTFKKEIIIELQKRVEGIFNLELQNSKGNQRKYYQILVYGIKNILAPQQWDILSTTSDSVENSDNGRFINVIPSISIEDQLLEVRLQKDAQFKEYQRLHSENKKLEEKPGT